MIRHTLPLAATTLLVLLLAPARAEAKRTWDVILEHPGYRCLVDIEGEDVTVKFYDRIRMGSYILVEHALALDRKGTWVIQGQITKSSRDGMKLGMGGKRVFEIGDRFYLFINKFTGDTLAGLRNTDGHFTVPLTLVERKGR